MAYLGKYIRQILSRQESVTLPGFGSLIISKSSGADSSSGKLEPPGVQIRFDPEHPRDDGKLAAEYAAGENLDPEEARQQVLELIDAIRFKLDKGEKFILELLGTFSRDDSNRIHFEKDPNWILDPDLFGLSSLDLLELEEEKTGEDKAETEDKAEVESEKDRKSDTAEISDNKDYGSSQEDAGHMKKKMASRTPVKKWRIIWIVVFALIMVLVLILMLPPQSDIEFSREGLILRENVVGEEESGLRESNDLVREEILQEEQEQADEQKPVEDTERSLSSETTGSEHNFFIIAGSFAELQNATELMESLKAEGFPAEIIRTETRLYRVSVKSFAEKQEALNELGVVKQYPGLGACWVWSR